MKSLLTFFLLTLLTNITLGSSEVPLEINRKADPIAEIIAGGAQSIIQGIIRLKKHLIENNGKKNSPGETRAALIVIDMQENFVTRKGFHKDLVNRKIILDLHNTQKRLIKIARETNTPIFFVEYENYGNTNPELISLTKDYKDFYLIKKKNDSALFGNPYENELCLALLEQGITDLVFIGANEGACVKATIESAFPLNFNIIICTHGIADFNFKDFRYPASYNLNIKNHPRQVAQTCCDHAVDNLFTKGELTEPCEQCVLLEQNKRSTYNTLRRKRKNRERIVRYFLITLSIFSFLASSP